MSINRRLVLATALVWAILIAPIPRSLDGWGIVLVLTLIALDVLLGVRTGWGAFRGSSRLDEREGALRDRAFRIAFRIVAVGIGIMIAAGYVSTILGFFVAHVPSQPALPDPLGARGIAALLELFLVAPTAVIAWLQPQPIAGTTLSQQMRVWLPGVAVPLVAIVWLTAITLLPTRSIAVRQVPGNLDVTGAHCGEFVASREAGYGFGAALRFHAAVCWDGHQAWVFGDPNLPEPPAVADLLGPNPPADPYSTDCSVSGDATDFATITNQRCTETIDAAGTTHYLVVGRVAPGLGNLGARELRLELTVTRDGRVLSFG